MFCIVLAFAAAAALFDSKPPARPLELAQHGVVSVGQAETSQKSPDGAAALDKIWIPLPCTRVDRRMVC